MKKPFILLFFLPLFFFSQNEEEYLIKNLHSLSVKNPNWKKLESKISLEEKIKLITFAYQDSTEGYCIYDTIKNATDFFNYYSDVFHFLDIDNDKDIDLVFSGMECPGYSTGNVIVYINKNNVLKRQLSVTGKAAEIKNKYLVIHEYPCCAMTVNTLRYYTIGKDNVSELTNISFHTYRFARTIIPIVPSKLKAGKIISLKYSSPVKLGAIDSLFQNAMGIKSVDIAKTKDGAEVKIYSAYKDKAKQKWLYVKIAYSDLIYDEVLHNVNIRKTALLGWIKEPK